jgi:hypothetical protein
MPSPMVMVEVAGAILLCGALLFAAAAQRKDDEEK